VKAQEKARQGRMPPKFVVLEGADGSGKTAVAAVLCDELRAHGEAVVRVSRVNPSGRTVYADVVAGIGQMFQAADEADTPLHLLALGAVLQHATMFESQVRPALDAGAFVVADSWWAKTRVRFSVEARRCTGWREADCQRFDCWLDGLLLFSYCGREADVASVLINTSKDDRVGWYRSLREKQAVYDQCGASTRDPAQFGEFTEEMQQRLRVIASQSRWPCVENRDGKDLLRTARDILAVVRGT
jgi:hypothetical protein